MKVHYIIVNGLSGCGKTTFTQMAIKKIEENNNYKAIIKSSIDQIKKIAKQSFEWDGIKDEPGRQLLFNLKAAAETYGDLPSHWVIKEVEEEVKKFDKTITDYFVFVDIRESANIKKFVDMVEAKNDITTICIHRDGAGDSEVKSLFEDIKKFKYEYYIKNSGTLEELQRSAEGFLKNCYGIGSIKQYNCPDCNGKVACKDCIRVTGHEINWEETCEMLDIMLKELYNGRKNN